MYEPILIAQFKRGKDKKKRKRRVKKSSLKGAFVGAIAAGLTGRYLGSTLGYGLGMKLGGANTANVYRILGGSAGSLAGAHHGGKIGSEKLFQKKKKK